MSSRLSPVLVRATLAATAEGGATLARQHLAWLNELEHYVPSARRPGNPLSEMKGAWEYAWRSAEVAAETSPVDRRPAWARDSPSDDVTAAEAAVLAGTSVQYLRRVLGPGAPVRGYRDERGRWRAHRQDAADYGQRREDVRQCQQYAASTRDQA